MYSSTFIFLKGQYDEEFYRLDETIAEAAKQIPGYLGEETWTNEATGLISNVYYWESLESLQSLMTHPKHVEAKRLQSNWLNGYQIIVSEIIRAYGDGKLNHPVVAFNNANSTWHTDPRAGEISRYTSGTASLGVGRETREGYDD
jgi:heme-degrading monooxygenase HmoA